MAASETQILYHAAPGQRILAVAEGGQVAELHIHRPGMMAGSLVLGRVLGGAPGTHGLFVEIGQERPGFLPQPPKSGPKNTYGQEILVQVKADAVGAKGATLSTDIAFQGRWLTYTPKRPGLACSRRIPDDEAERLTALLAPLIHDGEGVALRTSAQGVDADSLSGELLALRGHWQAIKTARAQSRPPAVLWRPDPLERLLALVPDAAAVRVSTPALLAEAKAMAGDAARLDAGAYDMIADALDEATAPVIALPSGGRIAIGQMAALTAIDVDSGTGSPEAANREAVTAVARALRLRGIGGQIAVDFIPAQGKGGGKTSIAQWSAGLKRALAKDTANAVVLGATAMGLIEITRERRGPSVAELLLEAPSPRRSNLTLALDALAQAVKEAAHLPGRALILRLRPEAKAALSSEKTALAEAKVLIPAGLTVTADPGLSPDSFQIDPSPK